MAFFTRKLQPSFSGYPRTRQRRDRKGRDWYIVDIRYLTPLRARFGDALGSLFSAALFFAAIFFLANHDVSKLWAWAIGLTAPIALADFWRAMFRYILHRRTRVALCRDLIRIRWRSYDRHNLSGIVDDYHHRFREEQETAAYRHQLAQRSKSKPRRIRLYYGEQTRILYASFSDNHVKICTAFGVKEWRAAQIMLNRINDALNGDLGAGIGRPLNASADTPEGRSGIPV